MIIRRNEFLYQDVEIELYKIAMVYGNVIGMPMDFSKITFQRQNGRLVTIGGFIDINQNITSWFIY